MKEINGEKTVDETILVDHLLPKRWECPHCRKVQSFGQNANEILMEHFIYLEHCEKCAYVHCWRLELTDEFKKTVVRMITGGDLNGE